MHDEVRCQLHTGQVELEYYCRECESLSQYNIRKGVWNLYVIASGFGKLLCKQSHKEIVILDVGLGFGYNASATIAAWFESPGYSDVRIMSLAKDAALVKTIAGGKAPWQVGWDSSWIAGPTSLNLVDGVYRAKLSHPRSGKELFWEIAIGDAEKIDWRGAGLAFDFIWQDPSTPELNPKMWCTDWFAKILSVANPEALLMTDSEACVVKIALVEAGWIYERISTPGKKRHALRARVKA